MSRVYTVPSYDHSEKLTLWNRVQDCEPIIEQNKKLQNEQQSGDFYHAAQIPNVIIEQWLNEERARGNLHIRLFSEEFNRLVHRKLNDPDWRYLRTDMRRIIL